MSEASKTPEFTLRPPSTNILYLICAEHMKGPAMTGCVVCALTEALDRAQRAEALPSWDKIIADLRSVVEQSSNTKLESQAKTFADHADEAIERAEEAVKIVEQQSSKIAALEKALRDILKFYVFLDTTMRPGTGDGVRQAFQAAYAALASSGQGDG